MGEASRWEVVGNLPAESLPIAGCRQERIDGLGANVTTTSMLAAIEKDLEQHLKVGRGREQAGVPGDAAEGVVGVAVADLARERVAAPAVPGVGVSLDQVAEAGIVNHAVLEGVAV